MQNRRHGLLAALGAFGLVGALVASHHPPDQPSAPAADDVAHASSEDAPQPLSTGARPFAQGTGDAASTLTTIDPVVAPSPSQPESVYLDGQVIIAPAAGLSLDDVAQAAGVTVLDAVGPSGYGALQIPSDEDPIAFADRLLSAGLAADAAPNGRIIGAGGAARRANVHQWHLDAAQAPYTNPNLSDYIVAVLDTGVAYENYNDKGAQYVAIDSLLGTRVVAPYDFINDDAHPNDDHQHGTHIASLIASNGEMEGIAPGVSLMPLKVLDENNQGNELALINALAWATDRGADVINMSLSFHPDYEASRALRRALRRAHKEGALMVAAAGNNGEETRITYPAAHRKVIAVGALTPNGEGGLQPASYSNRSSEVDLMAPGGDLSADRNHDGYVDGLLAETIAPQDGSQTGYWFYAGTSQATALVSGAAVLMLNDGFRPKRVRRMLERGADAALERIDGYGAGNLDLKTALSQVDTEEFDQEYYVAVLPYLTDDGAWVTPHAHFTVVNSDGEVVSDARLFGTMAGPSAQLFSCTTDADGHCAVSGVRVDGYDGDDLQPLAWSVSVGSVLVGEVSHAPGSALFLSDDLELLLTAIEEQDDAELEDALLAFDWAAVSDPVYGDLTDAITIINGGTGLASSPLGIVMTRSTIRPFTHTRDVFLNLDGTGLASSPLGIARYRMHRVNMRHVQTTYALDGTGLASSPLGIVRFLAIDATNSTNHAFNLSARRIMSPLGSSVTLDGIGFDGEPFLMGPAESPLIDISGTSFAARMLPEEDRTEAGWITPNGEPGASVMYSSGVIPSDSSASAALIASSIGGEPLEITPAPTKKATPAKKAKK